MRDLSKQTIKGYHLLRQIGEGAYGAVYRATQTQVQREVALKVILPEHANQPDFIRRFETEAHLVAQLEHLHIVPLYDYWREPDGAYLVMRLMKGGSLADLLENGAVGLDETARLLEQVASALEAAHRKGVVHRDLKPANILLDEELNAYLSDFGIAKDLGRAAGVTQTGAIVGSPAYISPEQVQSGEITPQTDIYALGVVLFEMLAGGHPFPDTPVGELVVRHLRDPLPSILEKRPDLPNGLDAVLQRATSKNPAERYPDALALVNDLRLAMGDDGVEILISEEVELTNPYKGLRAFQEADAGDFFGRETLTGLLLSRLAEPVEFNRFLALVGPSGSGKSSVVKAGLLPALRAGALPGSEAWFVVEMTPGDDPFAELAQGLEKVAINRRSGLVADLRKDEEGLTQAVRLCLPSDSDTLLLVIDQFEEVFTLVENQDKARHFLDSLYAAVTDPRSPVRVVVTLRADFYDRPLMHPDFSALAESRTQVVVPMTAEELGQAVRSPAEGAGAIFEPGLEAEIVADVVEQPGALPLLQYALTELFERREGRTLTRAAYREIGGVLGALGRRAEEVYGGLDEAERELARQLFLRLVTLGEGKEDTRRRVLKTELEGLEPPGEAKQGAYHPPLLRERNIAPVIDAFGGARLLSFDHDPATRGPTVEVAHEALLREWLRLRAWLDDSRTEVRMQRLLGNAASEWAAAGKDTGFLLRGSRLDQFEGWAQETSLALTVEERDFLEASLEGRQKREIEEAARQERERALEQRSLRRLRIIVAVLVAASILGIALTTTVFRQSQVARRNEAVALNSAATATVAQGDALHQASIAATNAAVAEAEVVARTTQQALAEEQAALGKSRELVALANTELNDPTDPSFGLALLLAREAVLATLDSYGYVTVPAEAVLNRAIERASSLLLTRQTHSGAITSVAWSPNGSQVLTASEDGAARVWDPLNGRELISLEGHEGRVNSAFWSPDGERIITGGFDGTARIWDAHNGSEISRIEQDDDVIYASWSPDGSRLFFVINNIRSTNTTNHIVIQDMQTQAGDLLIEFPGHRTRRAISDVNLDGTKIVTFPDTGNGQVWDARSGALLVELSGELGLEGIPISTDWHPAGTFIAEVLGHHTIGIWNGITGDAVAKLKPEGEPNAVAWSPDGALLAVGSSKGIIILLDYHTQETFKQILGPFSLVSSLAWSPDGTRLAAGFVNGELWVWDLDPGGRVTNLTHNQRVNMASWNPNGSLVATGSSDLKAYIWDPQTGRKLHELQGHFSYVWSVAWNPDGSRLATTGEDGSVRVWDPQSGQALNTLVGPVGNIYHAAWSPDGTRIASAGGDRIVRIWDVQSGTELGLLEGHTNDVLSVDWSHDGTRVVSASQDGTARIWDVSTGALIHTFEHADRVNAATWSPDDSKIVTADNQGIVTIWEVESGRKILFLEGHTGSVFSAVWSADGTQILTGSGDRTARIWDAITGEELNRFEGHEGFVRSAEWSPDGTKILTASQDHTARIWPLEDINSLLIQAESLIKREPKAFTTEERCLYLHDC